MTIASGVGGKDVGRRGGGGGAAACEQGGSQQWKK